MSLTSSPGQKSGSIKLAKKDTKEAKPAAAKKEKTEPKAEKKAAPKATKAKAEPKAKKETATKAKKATTTVSFTHIFWVNTSH